jgi:uncharacterized protein YqfB (UPF0267 family)
MKSMLEEFSIYGFRRYEELTLPNLGRINFILGDNNIGKTSILEALFCWSCGQNLPPIMYNTPSRGRYGFMQNSGYWEMEELLSMVHDRNTIPFRMRFEGVVDGKVVSFEHTIVPSDLLTDYDTAYKDKAAEFLPRISNDRYDQSNPLLTQMNRQITVAEWTVTENGNAQDAERSLFTSPVTTIQQRKSFCSAKVIDVLSHTGISEIAQIYAMLKRERLIGEVTDKIREIYPDITGFDMIPYPDGSQAPVSVVRSDGSMLPIFTCGDGVQRWFYILGCLVLYRNSILCIDEIDSGFHPKAQEKFCRYLIDGATCYNVQLFLTTHNLEFLDNFLRAAQNTEELDNIRILSLKEAGDSIKIRNLDAREAYKARKEFNLEMR